jgi:hypothetical protein
MSQQAQRSAAAAAAPAGADEQQQEQQRLAEEELRALHREAAAASIGMSRHPAVANIAAAPSDAWQEFLRLAAAALGSAADTQAGTEAWLHSSTQPAGAAATAQARLAAQQQQLESARRPLPRLHGPPPPASVGAAVRQRLFKPQYANQAWKRLLAEVTQDVLAEQAQQRRAKGSSAGQQEQRQR